LDQGVVNLELLCRDRVTNNDINSNRNSSNQGFVVHLYRSPVF
jgi:hypothetical protein